jgi:hypothetical protein
MMQQVLAFVFVLWNCLRHTATQLRESNGSFFSLPARGTQSEMRVEPSSVLRVLWRVCVLASSYLEGIGRDKFPTVQEPSWSLSPLDSRFVLP